MENSLWRSSWRPWDGCTGTTPSGFTATSGTCHQSSSKLCTPPRASLRAHIQATNRPRRWRRGPQIASQSLNLSTKTAKTRRTSQQTPSANRTRGRRGRHYRQERSRSCAATQAQQFSAPQAGPNARDHPGVDSIDPTALRYPPGTTKSWLQAAGSSSRVMPWCCAACAITSAPRQERTLPDRARSPTTAASNASSQL